MEYCVVYLEVFDRKVIANPGVTLVVSVLRVR